MTQPERKTQAFGLPGALLVGPHVVGHTIQRDEDHHAFVIDQKLILCTPMGYRVLALLLEQIDRCVPYTQLIALCQNGPTNDPLLLRQARLRMRHLVSDLRSKIWVLNWDIVSVMGTGYILLSSSIQE